MNVACRHIVTKSHRKMFNRTGQAIVRSYSVYKKNIENVYTCSGIVAVHIMEYQELHIMEYQELHFYRNRINNHIEYHKMGLDGHKNNNKPMLCTRYKKVTYT